MRLSLHTDYGLRVLMYLAAHPGRATVAEVADYFGISRDHVAKVVQRLARLGYLRSLRGAGGGLELGRPAEEIRLGPVIRDLEGNTHMLECVGSKDPVCVIQPACRLRAVLAEAERRQAEYLDGVRLSDVAGPGDEWVRISLNVRRSE